MAFSADEIRGNRDYFTHKLRAEKARSDVLHAVDSEAFDFVLLDTRGKSAFANEHIPGALGVSLEELDEFIPFLPKDKEIVTYCWGHD